MVVHSTKVYFQTIYAVKEYDIKNMQCLVVPYFLDSHCLFSTLMSRVSK